MSHISIPYPTVPHDSNTLGDVSFEDFDRLVLEQCGYDLDSPTAKSIMENVVADNNEEKIFTIRDEDGKDDKLKQSFNLKDTVDEILKNPSFDEYWRTHILDNLDTERDKLLLEQCNDSFIGEEVLKRLNELSKLEVFFYPGFFKEILGKAQNDEVLELVSIDDEAFESMPNVMRLY